MSIAEETAEETAGETAGDAHGELADEAESKGHPQRWLILAVALLGQFLITASVGVVMVALPSMKDDLHAAAASVQWVLVLYQLGFAVVLVTGGRLGDLFGRRRVFIVGLTGFVIASTLGALAPSVGFLVGARLLQGISGGVTAPQVLALIQVAFPPKERPRAFAAFGMVAGSGFMIGQLMSGGLIRLDLLGLGWRAALLVNLPLGAVAIVIAIAVLPDTGVTHDHRLDIGGMVLASVGGLLVLYPLIQGRAAGWPPLFLLLLAAAGPVLYAFIRLERKLTLSGGEPLVDVRLFDAPSFRSGILVAIAFSFSTLPTFYVMTLTLQLGFGFDPLKSALSTAATPVAVICASLLSARLLPRLGRRMVAVASTFGMLASVALAVTLTVAPRPLNPLHLIPALLLLGCNNGFGMTSIVNLTLNDVPEAHAGAASGVFQTVQQSMGAVGVAVAGIIFFGVLGVGTSADDHVAALRATLALTFAASCAVIVLHRLLPALPKDDEPEPVLLPDLV